MPLALATQLNQRPAHQPTVRQKCTVRALQMRDHLIEQALLVLDNCEQVIRAASTLAALLEACPW